MADGGDLSLPSHSFFILRSLLARAIMHLLEAQAFLWHDQPGEISPSASSYVVYIPLHNQYIYLPNIYSISIEYL